MAQTGRRDDRDRPSVDRDGDGPSAAGSRDRGSRATDDREPVGPDAVLDLASDGVVRSILSAIARDPKTASELTSDLDVSKATVYRRLNRLEDVGLVETTLQVDPDGHHRTVYRGTLAELRITVEESGFDVAAVTATDRETSTLVYQR